MPLKGFLEREKRMRAANAALKFFAPGTKIVDTWHGIAVQFHFRGKQIQRRWAVSRGTSWYPVWHSKWPHGGTATKALATLIRWVKHQPVLPLSTWRYWAGDSVNLMRDRGDECCELLEAADYPQQAECVLCGRVLTRFDWWCLKGVSGPCCNHNEGCRQQPEVECCHCNGTGRVRRTAAN